MAQWLKAMAALPEDLDLIPRIQMGAHNHPQLHFQGIWCPLLVSLGIACTSMLIYVGKTSIYTQIFFFKKKVFKNKKKAPGVDGSHL